jgi:hypothetical protein
VAEKVSKMPKKPGPAKMDEESRLRLQRRKLAVDTLRRQAEISEQRLRNDIFNIWRTGKGTMLEIGRACGYSKWWIGELIKKVKDDDELLEDAINQWLKENPGEELK